MKETQIVDKPNIFCVGQDSWTGDPNVKTSMRNFTMNQPDGSVTSIRFAVSKDHKDTEYPVESFPTPTDYKFALIPKLMTGTPWFKDIRLRTRLGRSAVRKFKKMRNRR